MLFFLEEDFTISDPSYQFLEEKEKASPTVKADSCM